MDALTEALEANRDEIQAALALAQAELANCERRCDELRSLIARAELVLNPASSAHAMNRLTLNQAMTIVLKEQNGGPVRAPEILREVRARGLYRQRSGGQVSLNQIHARVYHYPKNFERTPKGIRLRD